MVDSDRNDIEGWLNTIKPARRRREVAVALAARAALRVMPLLGRELTQRKLSRGTILSEFVLPPLRALAVAWAAGKYPPHGNELRTAAVAARAAVAAAADAAAPAFPAADAAFAARAAADAAAATEATAAAAALVARAAAAAAAAPSYTAAADAAVLAFAADAAFIRSGRSGSDLAGTPIWPKGGPGWAANDWQTLRVALLAANEGWEVWTDWYEARLAGDTSHPPNETLEIARATIADEIWEKGPAAVNAEIKRLIDGESQDQPGFEPILATRAALRVLPLLATDTDRIGDANKSKFALSVFHALAVAWVRTKFSTWVDRKLSVAAARNVSAFAEPSALAPRLVGNAAAEAAFAAGSVSPRVAARRASVSVTKAAGAIAAVSRDRALAAIVERANSLDKADIVPGVRPDLLGQVELWSGRDPPALIGQQWETLKEHLQFANEGWDVWIDWYEARLDGRIRSREVELAYVNYTKNVLSTASASEANSEIKRLIESASQNSSVSIGTSHPAAGTASFSVGDILSASVTTSAPPPVGPPPIESIPEQERTGTRFGMDAWGRIDVVPIPPAMDDLQRFHYDEMRHKAEALIALGQMLGDIAPAIIPHSPSTARTHGGRLGR
jgi:hypothetical protein